LRFVEVDALQLVDEGTTRGLGFAAFC
jgi:hypothetical protein